MKSGNSINPLTRMLNLHLVVLLSPSWWGRQSRLIDDPVVPLRSNDISWNFEKFLVDHQGFPVKRYLPSTEPFDVVDDIVSLIEAC